MHSRRIRAHVALIASATALLASLLHGGTAAAQSRHHPHHPPQQSGATPLERAHAHNDYEHERPLLDALDHGFTSVEADVWLVDGELLVAHDLEDAVPGRTLESLYLDPLTDLARANRGSVYPRWDGSLQLLIDVKSEARATYAAVDAALREHRRIMTTFTRGRVRSGAVTAVISGNRDLATMQAQWRRYAGYDGRLADLGSGLPASTMPLVSDNWNNHFTWQGVGPMPAAERAKLRDIVARAHAAGYRVRFWATPDVAGPEREAVWRELVGADVDHLNTDDLAGLQALLTELEGGTPGYGAPYTVLQMNLCLSGLAGCYGGTEYPAVVDEAVATIEAERPEAVTLNEACSGDAEEIAARTGYQVRFATVIYRGAPLPCVKPEGRGVFGNAVLTEERIVSSQDQAFTAQSGVEERRWVCATTVRRVSVCASHLSTRGTPEAQAANDAQCLELGEVLATYDARNATVFGGDVNRQQSCAPAGMWTRNDAAATQAPGIQHVYGSQSLRSPASRVVPATYTDHDFLVVDTRLASRWGH